MEKYLLTILFDKIIVAASPASSHSNGSIFCVYPFTYNKPIANPKDESNTIIVQFILIGFSVFI